MSHRSLLRSFLALAIWSAVLLSARASEKFDFSRDTFAFSNDTLWAYSIDAQGNLHMHQRAKPPEYTRRCFVMCRAVIQFHRFVRFDPGRPKLSEAQTVKLIRRICRIPVWMPAGEKTVIPGYADLRDFSGAHARVLQRELGNWWPSYFRLGNWRMAMPFPRIWQKKLAEGVAKKTDENKIQAVFLTRFRPLNHCVIAYGCKRLGNGDILFQVYDPNNAKAPSVLRFDEKSSSFLFGRTTYFNGGRVNAFAAYVAPWK